MNKYELCTNGTQKSFYGKALVYVGADGSETLYSYGTPIIRKLRNGALVRLWGSWSATTGRHIKAFCGLNKAGFMALDYESTPAAKAAAYSGTLYR